MTWSKEDILLNRLLFRSEEDDHDGPVRLIRNITDWDSFLEKSAIENTSPLVYYRLKALRLEKIIPPDTFREIERLYLLNLQRNLVILGEAKRVLERLRAEGIDFIVLKGLALAESVYPHFALRQMSDVDVLIRKERISEVDRILADLSYVAVDGTADEALRDPAGYLASLEYRKDRSSFLAFHIHWHLVNTTTPAGIFSEKIDLDRIWEGAIAARVADVDGRILHPRHQIMFLCEHALRTGHSFDRLILVYDIYSVLRRFAGSINWRDLQDESRNFGISSLVYTGLSVVRHYAPPAIPRAILESMKPNLLSIWEKAFLFLLSRNIRIRGLSILVYMGMHRNTAAKFSFLFRVFFPPAAIISHKAYGRTQKVGARQYVYRAWEILFHFISVLRRVKTGN